MDEMHIENIVTSISNFVNKYDYNEDRSLFCKRFSIEHRTLQQNFTKLCLAWINHLSNQDMYDPRNEASVKVCKEISEKVDIVNVLPCI